MTWSNAGALGAGVLMLLGSLFFLVTALGMLRSKDAISRVNNLSPATGAGLPLIIAGAALFDFAHGDLTVLDGVKAAAAISASLIVSSVASNMLGRAAYRAQTELDPRTLSNALEPYESLDEAAATPREQRRGDEPPPPTTHEGKV
ncbi:monovalent cation/H(+) antiporter subunit G [Nocardioides limicola]|uniref:monovalent cation/H(+) antiporter subunit G n=1 Tax=Nocardioides limicola TaxID=2803368 RepID=UPI00193B331A|nr:monovalent cation/H(+) antiporter subunit G [Nocardioides sp. DJM-14]